MSRRRIAQLSIICCVFLLNSEISSFGFLSNDVTTIFGAYSNAFYVLSGSNAWFANSQTSGSNPNNATYFWGQANEIESVLDAYEWTSNATYQAMSSNLLNGFSYSNGNGTNWSWDSYNDDVMWAVMAFARGCLDTGNANFGNIAKFNFDMAYARGWDTNQGGMYWTTGDTNKVAAVNGPASIAAYLLYLIYNDTNYLNKATNIYSWEYSNLFVPSTGMIYDGMHTNSPPSGAPTTYNQGTFIGAANFLGQTNAATLAANYTMNSMSSGGYLPRYGLANNNSGFNEIFLCWMTRFMKQWNLQSTYQLWLQGQANAVWNGHRSSDNLSWCQWPYITPTGTNFYSWDCISSLEAMLAVPPTQVTNAMTVTLLTSDASGASSFQSSLNWSNGNAPSYTNDYVVNGLTLRSPQDGFNHYFAGDSLTLSNGAVLACKNTSGGLGVVVGTALYLNNGEIADWSDNSTEVSGPVTLENGGGIIDPQFNALTISAQISGTGFLRIQAVDSAHTNGTVILNNANTYTGGTVLDANQTLELSGEGTLGTSAGPLTFSNTAFLGYGQVNLNGTSQGIGNLNGFGGAVMNSSTNFSVLTIGSGNTATGGNGDGSGTFYGKIVATATQPLSLTKAGAGTLTLRGNVSINSLDIGLNNSSATVTNGSVVVAAGGSLSAGFTANDSIAIASGTFNASTYGTLDVSGATSFNVNVGTLDMGVNAQIPGSSFPWTGSLLLGTNNNIVASDSMIIGDSVSAFNTSASQVVFTTAAGGTTTIQTPVLYLGVRKCNPTFTFGSGAIFDVGSSGSRTALGIGNAGGLSGSIGTGTTFGSTADFSAGIFNGVLSQLTIGSINDTGNGSENGVMILGSNGGNHLDIGGDGNVVILGQNYLGGGSGNANGTLTISNLNASSTIDSSNNSTAIILGSTAQSSGTLNLNGGTLRIITTGSGIAGGTGSSALNLNGITLQAGTNSASFITNISSTVINSGGVTFDTSGFNITIPQALSGNGGLTKIDTGKLTLTIVDTYTGNTMISAGTLALSGFGSIANSGFISISNGATLDASGRSDQTLTMSSGSTLKGSGTVLGNLNAQAGSIINPGDTIGTLNIQGNVALAGTMLMELNCTNGGQTNDQLAASGTIAVGGVLTVTNLGPPLQVGDTFQLFNQPVSGFSSFTLPALNAGLGWSNTLVMNGSIQVISTASMAPFNIEAQVNGNLLTLTWPMDHTGWTLESNTNLLGTNWTDIDGSSTTNQIAILVNQNDASLFFRMVSP